MAARHSLEILLHFPSEASAAAVAGAVAIESMDGPGRTMLAWSHDGATVSCRIEADEVGTLRAAMTGALRLADAAARVAD